MIKTILKKEKRKIIATVIVAGFFLFFWINGPFQQITELINLEKEATEYSNPKMVGGLDGKKKSTFGTIGKEEESHFGYNLILNKPKKKKYFGLLATAENNPGLSEKLKEQIQEHAKLISEGKVKTLASADMFYAITSVKNKKLIYIESKNIVENIRGYAGSINIGMLIDSEGKIKEIRHISSRETESYLQKIKKKGYYNQFNKLPLTNSHKIDAVTGATLTSEAIARTASILVGKATPYPLTNYVEVDELNSFSVSASLNYLWIVHILVIFFLFAYGVQKKWRKSKRGVMIISILSIVYIGFFLNNSFTYISFLHPFMGTTVSSLVGLYALFTLLGAIWGKNTYCKYVCPFGNVQRLMMKFGPSAKKKFFISHKWIKRIRGGLTLTLITGVLVGLRNWSNFELFPDLFGLQYISTWFFIALLSVVFTLIYPMIWCRLLCPTGSVLDAITDIVEYKNKVKK